MTWGLPDWIFHWAGYFGVALYLVGYGLLQAGLIRGSSVTYTLMNLAASSLVLVSLVLTFNLSSALIQMSWIVISIVGLTRMALQKRGLRFSDGEARLMAGHLSQMPGPMARRFFDAGQWHHIPTSSVLTQEGVPVQALHYLANGKARVAVQGATVAQLSEGFIGELNVMEAGPASATVEAQPGAEFFSISGQTLRKMAERDGDFRMILDRALTRDTATKLQLANQALAARPVT